MQRRLWSADAAETVVALDGKGEEDGEADVRGHPVRVPCQAALGRLTPRRRWNSDAAGTVVASEDKGEERDGEVMVCGKERTNELEKDRSEERVRVRMRRRRGGTGGALVGVWAHCPRPSMSRGRARSSMNRAQVWPVPWRGSRTAVPLRGEDETACRSRRQVRREEDERRRRRGPWKRRRRSRMTRRSAEDHGEEEQSQGKGRRGGSRSRGA